MEKLNQMQVITQYKEKICDQTQIFQEFLKTNEITQLIHFKIEETLKILCASKVELKLKPNGTKICVFCHEDFNKKTQKSNFTCNCASFHLDCLLQVCLKVSPDLDPFQMKDMKCHKCQKTISFSDIETSLGALFTNEKNRIEEKKNRKVKCQICNNEEKFDKMYERMCGHNFCPNCFKNHIENIIKKNKGNIRDYICPIEKCEFPKIEFAELKNYINKGLLNYYDDYLDKIYDSKKNNNLIFKCKTPDCYKIKVTTVDDKTNEYICFECENNQAKE